MALICFGVVLVCGLPGAGKSTLIESFVRANDNNNNDNVVPTTTTTTVIEYDRVQAEQQQQQRQQSASTNPIEISPVEAVGAKASSSSTCLSWKTGDDDDELQAWRQSRRVALGRLYPNRLVPWLPLLKVLRSQNIT